MKPGDKLFLIIGFSFANFQTFIPDPALFTTREEVTKWIELNKEQNIEYAYREIRIGSMK